MELCGLLEGGEARDSFSCDLLKKYPFGSLNGAPSVMPSADVQRLSERA